MAKNFYPHGPTHKIKACPRDNKKASAVIGRGWMNFQTGHMTIRLNPCVIIDWRDNILIHAFYDPTKETERALKAEEESAKEEAAKAKEPEAEEVRPKRKRTRKRSKPQPDSEPAVHSELTAVRPCDTGYHQKVETKGWNGE